MIQKRPRSSVAASKSDRIDDSSEFLQSEKPKSLKYDVFSSTNNVFVLCLAFRFANALLLQTYFNPDEHWQALEVAHNIAFGYGHLTWEWKRGIRSYLHPLLFAFLYKVLALLGLDTPLFMIKAPRLLQSIFSAVGDFYLYKLSRALFGGYVAKWTVSFLYFFSSISLFLSLITYFWEDNWLRDSHLYSLFPHLFHLSTLKFCYMASTLLSLGSSSSISLGLVRPPFDRESNDVAALLALIGDFAICGKKRFSHVEPQSFGQVISSPSSSPIFSLLWKIKIPKKLKFVVWKILHGKVKFFGSRLEVFALVDWALALYPVWASGRGPGSSPVALSVA